MNLSIALYYGKKYGEEKQVFFKNADIFVFPTSYPNECFPLVLLEAMEHALPCISTNEGGIADIIDNGKTGCIVYDKDAAALAKEIENLIMHKEKRESMGHQGRHKYKREFTLNRFEERLSQILSNNLS